jgi:hypothetical protein
MQQRHDGVQTEVQKRYLGKRQMELGIKRSPDRYPEEHWNMTFVQARAPYRVFCNRTPRNRTMSMRTGTIVSTTSLRIVQHIR